MNIIAESLRRLERRGDRMIWEFSYISETVVRGATISAEAWAALPDLTPGGYGVYLSGRPAPSKGALLDGGPNYPERHWVAPRGNFKDWKSALSWLNEETLEKRRAADDLPAILAPER